MFVNMESSEDVEVLSRAIEKLLDEKRKREAAGDSFIEDEDDQLLLTKLISQVPFLPPPPSDVFWFKLINLMFAPNQVFWVQQG